MRNNGLEEGSAGVHSRLTRARTRGYTSPSAALSECAPETHRQQPENPVHRIRSLLAVFLVVAASVASSACSDPFASQPWSDIPAEATLFSASREAYVGRASAFDLLSTPPRVVAIESESGAGSWDVVLVDNNGSLALESAATFTGITSRSRIGVITGTAFADVLRAPKDTTDYTVGPVNLRMDAVYIVKSRVASCALTTGPTYAKLQPVLIDVPNGIFRFNYVANPNCDDRSLVAPEEE